MDSKEGFSRAGLVSNRGLNLAASELPTGRQRHAFGNGPFARLVMPPLPIAPGLYLWQENDEVVYVGQTRIPLKERLGSRGYSTISSYNTLARQVGRKNGGQQTNCRVNSLANASLSAGHELSIWYRVTRAAEAAPEEARWMTTFRVPKWNLSIEQ